MRVPLSAATALVPVLLVGCTLFDKPTPVALKRCVVIGNLPIGQPLSVLEKALTANGASALWQRGKGRTYLLRISKTDQLNGKTTQLGFEIDQADNGMTAPGCGPGAAIIIQATVNGEDMGSIVAENALINAVEAYLGHKLGQAPASPAPAAPPPPPAPSSATTNESDIDEVIEDDRAFYAKRAEEAAAKPIAIAADGYRYCCLSVGRVYNEPRARGSTVTIDTFDDGTIEIEVKSPTPLWLGYSNLTLEFVPADAIGVEIKSVKAGNQEIASSQDDGKPAAASFLIDNFRLSKAAE